MPGELETRVEKSVDRGTGTGERGKKFSICFPFFHPSSFLLHPSLLFLISATCCAGDRVTPKTVPGVPEVVPLVEKRLTTNGLDKMDVIVCENGSQVIYSELVNPALIALQKLTLEDGKIERLHPDAKENEFGFAFSRDETKQVYTHNPSDLNLRVVIKDASGEETGEVRLPGFANLRSPAFTNDGTRVLYAHAMQERQQILSVNLKGEDPQPLTDSSGINDWPTMSPDGKFILFGSTRDGNFDIYLMLADGTNVRRLTDNPFIDMRPRFSPDGSRIVFTSNRDGNYELYLMNADGTHERRLTHNPEADDYAYWHPDGKHLIYVAEHKSRKDLYLMTLPEFP